jgi:hypothetical protein
VFDETRVEFELSLQGIDKLHERLDQYCVASVDIEMALTVEEIKGRATTKLIIDCT